MLLLEEDCVEYRLDVEVLLVLDVGGVVAVLAAGVTTDGIIAGADLAVLYLLGVALYVLYVGRFGFTGVCLSIDLLEAGAETDESLGLEVVVEEYELLPLPRL